MGFYGAAVSTLLNRLAPLIEKKVRQEVSLLRDPRNKVRNLAEKLKLIQEVLADAERKLLKNDKRVERWLEKLRDIAYEIDDALDEWEVENIKRRLKQDSEDASWEAKVSSFLQSVCCLCPQQTVRRRSIALNIEQINARLDLLAQEDKDEFNFIPKLDYDSQHRHENHAPRRHTTSFVDVSEILGRDSDKETLLRELLPASGGDEGGVDGLKIVSIVGAGGMGKTSLAQLVFNDKQVKEQFDHKIWVCVSNPFDDIKIVKAILKDIGGDSSGSSELQSLLQSIKELLLRKRFFLVLDDVWTEDDLAWKPLKACLQQSGALESRILLTTRRKLIANVMQSGYMHELKPLAEVHCWSILRQIALRGKEENEYQMFEEVGKKIAQKCKGLPLVARTIGSLLCFKSRLEQWRSVLESEMWELEEVRKDIFPILRLSYDELQHAIKRCFSYCAIFPKDEELEIDQLVRVWMAQGFVSPLLSPTGTVIKEMEEVGREYFEDLALRSFFRDFEKDIFGNLVNCKMHDIVHDFAQFLTKNECLIVQQLDRGTSVPSNKNVVRHLTAISKYGHYVDGDSDDDQIVIEEKLKFAKVLSTVTYEPKSLRSFFYKNDRAPEFLSNLKRVRLLIMRDCGLEEIPKEIGNLIHMRYLDVSKNPIKELPEVICDLYNLQTLNIELCRNLSRLPQGIHNLMNLRHLLNFESLEECKFPQQFEKLVNLKNLGEFRATSQSHNKLGWLKNLNQLEGSLRIFIDSAVDEMQAKEANLINKRMIKYLQLWCINDVSWRIIEALQPHENLETLFFVGLYSPTWIPTLTRLKSLYISGLSTGDLFPILGKLTLLEQLLIEGWGMERMWIDQSSTIAFPKLKILSFYDCRKWQEWEDIIEEQNIIVFPLLKELEVYTCPELKSLPHGILGKAASLETVVIGGCYNLKSRYNIEEDWKKISPTSVLEIWW